MINFLLPLLGFVSTASTSKPWMVTHPSANRGPSCLTSCTGNWYNHSYSLIPFPFINYLLKKLFLILFVMHLYMFSTFWTPQTKSYLKKYRLYQISRANYIGWMCILFNAEHVHNWHHCCLLSTACPCPMYNTLIQYMQFSAKYLLSIQELQWKREGLFNRWH